ncbi:hypothetical protein ACWD5R_00420 [Streptomyces sp. NPDC002514]|uniref:hypothetical protein n=1 Tax=unclassified Streptomyces TaxID=2593676 RepID=UPI0036B5893E
MSQADETGAPVATPVDSSGTPPADYRLLLPEGWFLVPVSPDRRERSVDVLINRQFEGVDNAPHIKRQLRDKLLAQAAAAYQGGGIELYISLQQAGPLTIPASLLITLLPTPHSERALTAQDFAARLSSDGEADVSIVELPAGTAVRTRTPAGQPTQSPPVGVPGSTEPPLPSVTLTYQVPVPTTRAYLLLTFSTPLVEIADVMIELFDAVAGSMIWTDGEQTHE